MNREELDGWCERGIQGLVLAILLLGPLALGAVDAVPFVAIEGLTILVCLLWAARFWINPRLQLLWPPINWVVIAFALYTVIRYFNSEIEYVARGEMLHVLIYAFLFLAIVNNLHRQDATQFVACALVLLAMAISFYALYQFVTGSTRVWNGHNPYPHRGTGTYINPNHLGGFLEMVLPLALAFTLVSRFKAVPRILLGYAALVILAGIAVTGSRGSWLATGITVLVFFALMALNRVHRLPALLLLAVIITGSMILIPKSRIFHLRANQLMVNGKIDDDKRFELWRPAMSIWRENFWWGGGPDHYNERFRRYRPIGVQLQPDHAHNDYLNTLADYGLAGTSLIALAMGTLAVGVVMTWRKVRPAARDIGQKLGSNKYAFIFGASLGLFAILPHSLVDFNLHIPANAILAVALMALLSGYTRFSSERFWFRARPWIRMVASVVLIAASFLFAEQGVRQYQEHTWLVRADRSAMFSPEQIKFLQRAFQVEPMNWNTAYDIGEALRRQAQEGGAHYLNETNLDYTTLTHQAMQWFEHSARLNPFNSNAPLGYGWCLDWLGNHSEASTYFVKAEELDPNSYFTMFKIGLHYMESGDYSAAKPMFERSLRLEGDAVATAGTYLQIANARMAEAATNDMTARIVAPGK